MKVLLVGGGGREHAIAWKLAQSPMLEELLIAPGNPGTAKHGRNVPVKATDIPELLALAKRERVDLVFVGPEQPIALGITNRFAQAGVPVFAPRAECAQLEASKVWAKSFMKRHRIPTAPFEVFDDFEEAKDYVYSGIDYPKVIKADGLAGGKGAVVVKDKSEALRTLEAMMLKGKFGEAGKTVVIEDFLRGPELSVFVVSDGLRWRFLGAAADYKRLLDADQGPNTGGMGSVSPVPFLTEERYKTIVEKIIEPTFDGLFSEGLRYKGILYFGLMWTDQGPYVLEYNVRLGDPEAQVVLPLLKGDLLEIAKAGVEGRLDEVDFGPGPGAACCVVMASEGYPEAPVKGRRITGLEEAEALDGVLVFQAGTKEENGELLTAGGRVLGVVGLGETLEEAKAKAYEGVSKIHFEGAHYRKDIGQPERFKLEGE